MRATKRINIRDLSHRRGLASGFALTSMATALTVPAVATLVGLGGLSLRNRRSVAPAAASHS